MKINTTRNTTLSLKKSRLKYLVVGSGTTGIATAKVLKSLGIKFKITDTRPLSQLEKQLKEIKSIQQDAFIEFKKLTYDFDTIVVSPGVSFNHPYIKNAIQKKIDVISEIELAYRLFPHKIVAITGTNGKTTTTALVGKILKSYFKNVEVAGNIGYPLIEACSVGKDDTIFVTEVSSYQLEGIKEFKPIVSAVLNIDEDHIEWHGNFTNYINAKKKIFMNQNSKDYAVLNYDDFFVNEIAKDCAAQKFFFSKQYKNCQVFFDNGTIYKKSGKVKKEIIKEGNLYLKGMHNIDNAMASISIGICLNIPIKIIKKSLKEFKPFRHRIEFTDSINGKVFINDSKSTNVASTKSAILAFKQNKILILGGESKGLDMYPLVEEIVGNNIKSVVILGNNAKHIALLLIQRGYKSIYFVDSMREAVLKSYSVARDGDVVLFSPALPSFDKYHDYEERGNDFSMEVRYLRENILGG